MLSSTGKDRMLSILEITSDAPEKTSSKDAPPKFTTPDHPSLTLLEKTSLSGGTQDPPPYTQTDPHSKPNFMPGTSHTSPILYLPPLISSLPKSHPPVDIPHENPPLTTETRLPDIDPVSLSLHKALHYFRPYSDKYASRPYAEAFNWSDLNLPLEEEREWYCVAFRSRRKAGSDSTPLYDADRLAHEEAVQNGGLLMYWYGVPDPDTGLNLATCIWQSRRHAIAANSRPHHIKAMTLARDSYDTYILERYVLRKAAGVANVSIEIFEGGDIGW